MIGIYCITNTINNKKYIGQSTNINKRWLRHLQGSFNPHIYKSDYNTLIHRAIRKYGKENFKLEILEECSKKDLNEREMYWIGKYKTFPPSLNKGYNNSPGGSLFNDFKNYDKLKYIIGYLKLSKLKQRELAYKFNVDQSTISNINKGKYWNQPNENYPIRRGKI